jgi:hypothetical protein
MKFGFWFLLSWIIGVAGIILCVLLKIDKNILLSIGFVFIFLSWIFLVVSFSKFLGQPIKNLSNLSPHHYTIKSIDEDIIRLVSVDGVIKYVDRNSANNPSLEKGNFVMVAKYKHRKLLQIIHEL